MNTAFHRLGFPHPTYGKKDSREFLPNLDRTRHVDRLQTLQEISHNLNPKLEPRETPASITQDERNGVLYLENHLKASQFRKDDLTLAIVIAD